MTGVSPFSVGVGVEISPHAYPVETPKTCPEFLDTRILKLRHPDPFPSVVGEPSHRDRSRLGDHTDRGLMGSYIRRDESRTCKNTVSSTWCEGSKRSRHPNALLLSFVPPPDASRCAGRADRENWNLQGEVPECSSSHHCTTRVPPLYLPWDTILSL